MQQNAAANHQEEEKEEEKKNNEETIQTTKVPSALQPNAVGPTFFEDR